jgi:hypothetical protein
MAVAALLLHSVPVFSQEEVGPQQAAEQEEAKGGNYEQCAAFRSDIDADLGEVLQAGCEPTLEQMSALMDNPIGNVAMMFNQVDAYKMEDPISGTTANQFNYMALFQFPVFPWTRARLMTLIPLLLQELMTITVPALGTILSPTQAMACPCLSTCSTVVRPALATPTTSVYSPPMTRSS